ncbi:MAG: dihydroxy-acid dehydratase, partial [Planctomycetes bacterium]|nr:dihydroxy-acid dehydratase [Planctomycetota bacterium]
MGGLQLYLSRLQYFRDAQSSSPNWPEYSTPERGLQNNSKRLECEAGLVCHRLVHYTADSGPSRRSDGMKHLNWNSRNLTRGWQRGVTAFFYGLGMTDEDFDKPQIGIGVPLLEGNLCNVHAYELAQEVKESCRNAGLVGFPFGVPGVSDNITQGMEGGNASLPSRNMIANAAECVVSAHSYDALVGLHNCDKNGPGFAMALARLNYPGLILSGGSIHPGQYKGRNVTILDVYDSQAAAAVGSIEQEEADE